MDIFASILSKNSDPKLLGKNLELIASTILRVVDTNESFQNKKVKKTAQCVGLFVKAIKLLIKSDLKDKFGPKIQTQGALVIKALESACEKDKAMSNLKGKAKEIKALISNF